MKRIRTVIYLLLINLFLGTYLFANINPSLQKLAYNGEALERSNFSGFVVRTGYLSLYSSESIGQELLLDVSGPDLLLGINMVQNGLGTQIEIDVSKSVGFLTLFPFNRDEIIVPDLLITPRLIFTFWILSNLGIGWGSSWSIVIAEWAYAADIHYISTFAIVQYAFSIRAGEYHFLLIPDLEFGIHWDDLRLSDATNLSGVGFQWTLGARLLFPFNIDI